MKLRHSGIFFACSFFAAVFIAAIFCSVALVAMVGGHMSPAGLPLTFVQTTAISWLYIVALRYLFEPIVWVVEKCKNLSFKGLGSWLRRSVGCVLVLMASILCQAQTVKGEIKSPGTGMVTQYDRLTPGNTVLVMNGEELNHTDIPLGESFVLVNKNVEGLVAKNGKVAVGCSLQIISAKGKVLINKPDLFKTTGGIYSKSSAQQIQCTINAGKPMDWDQTYTIVVRFWDKYGKGMMEHRFNINTIDIP